jgi:cytochrome c biogenesis protein CcdA
MQLLLVLASIALLDSASIVPISIVPLAILLGGKKPLLGAGAFIAGVVVVYLAVGLLLVFGLNAFFDPLNAYLLRLWKEPNTVEIVVSTLLGVVMILFGVRLAATRASHGDRGVTEQVTPAKAFGTGAVLTLIGMPGGLPYFAALDQILRSDVGPVAMVTSLLFYNLIFALPLASIVLLRVLLGRRGDRILKRINAFMDHWGQRMIVSILLVLGLVLVLDGIGWLLGRPLIPV